MARTILGIDLGSAQIKLTLMELSGEKAAILGQERLNRDGNAPPERVAESVGQAIGIMGLAASKTFLCLSSREALFLPLSLPFSQTKKIREVLPLELASRISVEVDDYLWDFLILGGEKGSSSRILAAMYPRQKLTAWLDAFEAAGISIDRLELDVTPLAGLSSHQSDPATEDEVLLDIGWSKTNLARLEQGRLISLATVSPGLRRLFPDSRGLEGQNHASSPQDEVAFGQRLRELVDQIRLALLTEAEQAPKKLTVIGGGALIPELLQALQESLGSRVKPLEGLDWEIRGYSEDRPLTALSASLCLQGGKKRPGFNLLPAEYSGHRTRPAWRRFSRPLAVALGLILLTWSLSLGSSIYLEHKALTRLNDQLEQTFRSIAPDAKQDLRPIQYASVIKARIRDLQSGRAGEGVPPVKATELLAMISRSVPEGTSFQITLLSMDASGLRLNGLAKDYKAVDSLQTALSDLDILASVEIIGANVDSRGEGVSFSLRLQLP